MHIVQSVAGSGLVLTASVLASGETGLVEVQLSILDCNLELLEPVGLCLEVASRGLIEATVKVWVLGGIRVCGCASTFAASALLHIWT